MLSVVSTQPGKDAVNVSPGVTIEIIFSEAVDTSTFSSGMVYVKNKDGTEVNFTTQFSSDNLRLEIIPTSPLNADTAYTVYLSPVDLMTSKSLTASNGDTLDNNYFFDFYTSSSSEANDDVSNVYTDPLYNTPFTISEALRYTGMSANMDVIDSGGVLVLNFSTDIDPSSPEPLVMMNAETYTGEMYDPQPNVTVTGSHLYITFGALLPNSRLYINIPNTLKGSNGTSLTDTVNTFAYSYLSPKPFPIARLLARFGYKSRYFDGADIYEASMEAMLTAGSWANVDLFSYDQYKITPRLSMALVYLTMGILITKKYLNSAIDQNVQITIDVTTYKSSGMSNDLGAKYTKVGIDMLRSIFPIAPSAVKHAVRIFRPRWSNKVVFDKPYENRSDNSPAFRSGGSL